MNIYAIRGAITVNADDADEISANSVLLAREIAEKNVYDSVISVIVSTTEDITACYPAKAIRESGVLAAPIFSCKEPSIRGALPLCIRLLVTVASSDDGFAARHVYLGKAKELRKDLAE